ncbi:MAG TPA: hypothetical protein VK474_06635 [Chthoniobacterales bacterium]|nr:hypothetical protein [Chthoniobacterales bacterium]
MKIPILLALLGFAVPIITHATPADEQFQKLADDYIASVLRNHPEAATGLGDHRFDDRLTDYSAESRARELADDKALLEKLNSFSATAVFSCNGARSFFICGARSSTGASPSRTKEIAPCVCSIAVSV